MAAFIIFWASVLAILFFALGTICKGLAATMHALILSVGRLLGIGFLTGLVITILYLAYVTTDGIIHDGIQSVTGCIGLIFLVGAIILASLGRPGAAIKEYAADVAEEAAQAGSKILEWLSDAFEKGYRKSLTVVMERMEKW